MTLDFDKLKCRLYFYIFPMIFIYPIGVPLFYSLIFYIHRHALGQMQRNEVRSKAEAKRAEMLRRKGRFEEAAAMDTSSEEAHQDALDIMNSMPPMAKKLMAGYNLTCYWFEVIECLRKILLSIPTRTRTISECDLPRVCVLGFSSLSLHHSQNTNRRARFSMRKLEFPCSSSQAA